MQIRNPVDTALTWRDELSQQECEMLAFWAIKRKGSYGTIYERGEDDRYVGSTWRCPMRMNTEKIDQAVLALLSLTIHNDGRAWKSFDWDALNRLHEKGFILNPVNKAKSVVLTDEGIAESARLFAEMFETDEATPHDAIDTQPGRGTT